jgi:hypothetical protein
MPMSSRFRNLVGSKRKASGNSLTQSPSISSLSQNTNTNTNSSSLQPSSSVPNNIAQSPPQSSSERNSTASTNTSNPNTTTTSSHPLPQQLQHQAGASTTSLAMNPHQHPQQPPPPHASPPPGQQPPGRPPSYQYVNQVPWLLRQSTHRIPTPTSRPTRRSTCTVSSPSWAPQAIPCKCPRSSSNNNSTEATCHNSRW